MLSRVIVIAAVLIPAQAVAWGRDGHRMLSAMAESRLTPVAFEKTRQILGTATLSSVSTWSDEVRGDRPETAPWHYVNIHISQDALDPVDCPNGDCVSGIVTRLAASLSNPQGLTPLEREEALKHLVHFVGDQSQPMHNANEDDLGGNTKSVTWFGRRMNLHSVWDSGFTDYELERRGIKPAQFATELNDEIRAEQIRVWIEGTSTDWTNESHRAAIEFGYPGWKPVMGEEYFRKNIGQVRLQLQRGAIRLAHVLNTTFDPGYNGELPVVRPLDVYEPSSFIITQ